MKQVFILFVLSSLMFIDPLKAGIAVNPHTSADQLRKEVAAHFKRLELSFLEKNVETVKVSFLINAKHQLVISNVEGEDADACAYVKNVLNFKHVDFIPAKQLTRYAVEIRLVRE
jgi:hypothetical protein